MAEEAWGRWGPQDEIGAFNLLSPNAVRRAAELVSQGRVLSLAQTLSSATPTAAHRCGFSHFMTRDGADHSVRGPTRGNFGFADDVIVAPLHVGTHIDALCHAWRGDKLYNGFPVSSVRSHGAAHCSVDKLPPFVGRGVLLDVAHVGPEIGADALRAALGDTVLEVGDAALIRTGWLERQTIGATWDFNTEPGINVEAAEWLAEAGVALIGADNFAIEQMPFKEGEVFPVHQRLIGDYGVPLLEGLVLAPLSATGRTTFLFITAPLPIVGATGSPVTPLAIL